MTEKEKVSLVKSSRKRFLDLVDNEGKLSKHELLRMLDEERERNDTLESRLKKIEKKENASWFWGDDEDEEDEDEDKE